MLLSGCTNKFSSGKLHHTSAVRNGLHYRIIKGDITDNIVTQLATGKAVPFDWGYRLVDSAGVTVQWHENVNTDSFPFAKFRISTATDVREPCVFDVRLAKEGLKLGELDISFATYLQVRPILLISCLRLPCHQVQALLPSLPMEEMLRIRVLRQTLILQ